VSFFTDENISPRVAQLLEVFDPENEVRAHKDSFAKGTPDTQWLQQISTWTPKPVVVCGDGRILRNRAELAILKE
jgi:hypothetical protein